MCAVRGVGHANGLGDAANRNQVFVNADDTRPGRGLNADFLPKTAGYQELHNALGSAC